MHAFVCLGTGQNITCKTFKASFKAYKWQSMNIPKVSAWLIEMNTVHCSVQGTVDKFQAFKPFAEVCHLHQSDKYVQRSQQQDKSPEIRRHSALMHPLLMARDHWQTRSHQKPLPENLLHSLYQNYMKLTFQDFENREMCFL